MVECGIRRKGYLSESLEIKPATVFFVKRQVHTVKFIYRRSGNSSNGKFLSRNTQHSLTNSNLPPPSGPAVH